MFFEDNIDDAKYLGHLFGLGPPYIQNGASYENNHTYVAQNSTVHNSNNSEEPGSNQTNSS